MKIRVSLLTEAIVALLCGCVVRISSVSSDTVHPSVHHDQGISPNRNQPPHHSSVHQNHNQAHQNSLSTDLDPVYMANCKSTPICPPHLNDTHREELAAHLQNTFKNRHVVFIGDSVTRYQYLALVSALHNNITLHPCNAHAPVINHGPWKAWSKYYEGVPKLFAPYEKCDCYHSDRISGPPPSQLYENRHYHNKERNFTLSFLQFFGEFSHGHLLTPWITNNSDPLQNYQTDFVPEKWRYNLIDLFPQYIAKFEPKVDVIMFNLGFWAVNDVNTTYAQAVVKSALTVTENVVYRMTNTEGTKVFAAPSWDRNNHVMCGIRGVKCLNTSWTDTLALMHVDGFHFREPIYTEFNMQLAGLVHDSKRVVEHD